MTETSPTRDVRCLQVIRSLDRATGGPAYAVFQLRSALREQSIDVDIVTTGDAAITGNVESDDGAVITLRRQFGRTWSFSWPFRRWLGRHIQNYDVVHITGVFTYPAYAAAKLALSRSVPYVIRPAGTLDTFAMQQKARKKALFFRLFLRKVLNGAAAIHATSESERENLAALGITAPIIVVPLSVRVPPVVDEPTSGETPHIVTISRLHPIKAVPNLLRAADILRRKGRPIRLTIAGDGDPAYLEQLRALAASLGIDEATDFAGFVEGEDKDALLRQADVFVSTSYQESFGVAIAEAMAAAVPVVVSDAVAIAGEIENAGGGFVVPVDQPDTLADAIEAFFDPRTRADAGKRARQLVQDRYSREAQGRGLRSMYEDVLARTWQHAAAATEAPGHRK